MRPWPRRYDRPRGPARGPTLARVSTPAPTAAPVRWWRRPPVAARGRGAPRGAARRARPRRPRPARRRVDRAAGGLLAGPGRGAGRRRPRRPRRLADPGHRQLRPEHVVRGGAGRRPRRSGPARRCAWSTCPSRARPRPSSSTTSCPPSATLLDELADEGTPVGLVTLLRRRERRRRRHPGGVPAGAGRPRWTPCPRAPWWPTCPTSAAARSARWPRELSEVVREEVAARPGAGPGGAGGDHRRPGPGDVRRGLLPPLRPGLRAVHPGLPRRRRRVRPAARRAGDRPAGEPSPEPQVHPALRGTPLGFAHRGWTPAPDGADPDAPHAHAWENTLEAFAAALDLGLTHLETDVQGTARRGRGRRPRPRPGPHHRPCGPGVRGDLGRAGRRPRRRAAPGPPGRGGPRRLPGGGAQHRRQGRPRRAPAGRRRAPRRGAGAHGRRLLRRPAGPGGAGADPGGRALGGDGLQRRAPGWPRPWSRSRPRSAAACSRPRRGARTPCSCPSTPAGCGW